MQPNQTPGKVPKSEEIKEPKKSFPTIEMDTKAPDFNSEKKKSEVLTNEDEDNKKDGPEVNDQQQAP